MTLVTICDDDNRLNGFRLSANVFHSCGQTFQTEARVEKSRRTAKLMHVITKIVCNQSHTVTSLTLGARPRKRRTKRSPPTGTTAANSSVMPLFRVGVGVLLRPSSRLMADCGCVCACPSLARNEGLDATAKTQVRDPHSMDCPPKRWPESPRTAVQRANRASNRPNHLGLRCNALPEHQNGPDHLGLRALQLLDALRLTIRAQSPMMA